VARYRDTPDTRDVKELSGDGNLTVTIENEDLSQRYQGIVPLDCQELAGCLQGYFENSEQLPTRLWLSADASGVSGLLLQRLPDDSVAGRSASGDRSPMDPAEIEDAWNRVQLLAETLKPAELRGLTDQEILHRLFAEDDVRLFDQTPVFFRCRCSRERVEGMLRSLGAEEIKSVLAERGSVEVRCDFCNRAYQFDAVDVEHLFAVTQPTGRSGKVH
jgi:molecular chaperone Hsp33